MHAWQKHEEVINPGTQRVSMQRTTDDLLERRTSRSHYRTPGGGGCQEPPQRGEKYY